MPSLLFITQRMDKDDSILGVYHRWVEKLAEGLESIQVICLYKGRVELPGNVKVYSLGKETLSGADLRGWRRGFTRIKYIARFWKYLWRLRRDYDAVFVHMNPVYVILGGWFWQIAGKPTFLWYNHPMGGLTARIGIKLADKVFCTSAYSFAARYSKSMLMPVGVDTSLFRPLAGVERKHNRILCLGRISPIKKLEYLVAAAKMLDSEGIDLELLIVGDPVSGRDWEYKAILEKTAGHLVKRGKVVFKPSVPNYEAPALYNSSNIFVNLTPTGSLDKTIIEAMACGSCVLVSNKVFRGIFPESLRDLCLFEEGSTEDCASKLKMLLALDSPSKKLLNREMPNLAMAQHSLDALVLKLTRLFDCENKSTIR